MSSDSSGRTGIFAQSPVNVLVAGRDKEMLSVVIDAIRKELPQALVHTASTPAQVQALMLGEVRFRFVVVVDDRDASAPQSFPKGCVLDSLADVLGDGGSLSEDFFVALGYRVVGLHERNPYEGMMFVAASDRDARLPEEFSRWRPPSVGIGLRIGLSPRVAPRKHNSPRGRWRRGRRRP